MACNAFRKALWNFSEVMLAAARELTKDKSPPCNSSTSCLRGALESETETGSAGLGKPETGGEKLGVPLGEDRLLLRTALREDEEFRKSVPVQRLPRLS
jgi:hypothetical protein